VRHSPAHRGSPFRAAMLAGVVVAVGAMALLGKGAPPADAAFHCMRVAAVMGGAFGDADIQYVELRMNAGGQNVVGGHDITFRNATGALQATFVFPSNVASGANGASILIATAEFDAISSVEPDFLFSDGTVVDPDTLMTVPQNTTGAGNLNHPIQAPDGKVAFEEQLTACLGSGPPVDSVAYGDNYTGPVDYGTHRDQDLPVTGKQALVVSNLGLTPSNNSTEYSVQTIPFPIPSPGGATTPRNNAGVTGNIGFDADGDGVEDALDNCLTTFNPDQRDSDGDSIGDVCDPDVDGDGLLNGNDPDDDGDGYLDVHETAKGSDPINPNSRPEHCDGVDNDLDTVLDEPTALSGRATPDPLCDAGADPDGDTIPNSTDTDDDGDTFSDVVERYMSSDELDNCRVVAGHDAWPPDADANGTANVGDLIQLFGGGKILQNTGQPFYSRRSDATANGAVNVGDLIAFFGGGKILSSC
jgi:hypothetical protein